MSEFTFRMAREEDAARLLAIYTPYIETSITFETEPPSLEEFTGRIREIRTFYPYLVAERDGKIVGYAYAHRAFQRAAYRWDAELSVYLDREERGHGLGAQLYHRLISILRLQRMQTVYAIVTSPNPASEHLHERLGFHKAGFFENSGFKNGEWHGVTWYDLSIGDKKKIPPEEIVSVNEIPQEKLEAILTE